MVPQLPNPGRDWAKSHWKQYGVGLPSEKNMLTLYSHLLSYISPLASSRLMQAAEGQIGIMHAAFDEAIKAASHWTSGTIVWFPQQWTGIEWGYYSKEIWKSNFHETDVQNTITTTITNITITIITTSPLSQSHHYHNITAITITPSQHHHYRNHHYHNHHDHNFTTVKISPLWQPHYHNITIITISTLSQEHHYHNNTTITISPFSQYHHHHNITNHRYHNFITTTTTSITMSQSPLSQFHHYHNHHYHNHRYHKITIIIPHRISGETLWP